KVEKPYEVGQALTVELFAAGEIVDVVGVTKGKGFQGGVKRHGWRGGEATHGSMFHRAPGSIGASSDPSRVWPGHKLPGRMGGVQRTTLNVSVARVLPEQNLILIRGAVPGANGSRVMGREALRAAVAARIADGALRVVERVEAEGKTKALVAALTALGVAGEPTLLVTAAMTEPLARAARNVPWLIVESPAHVSVYQLL